MQTFDLFHKITAGNLKNSNDQNGYIYLCILIKKNAVSKYFLQHWEFFHLDSTKTSCTNIFHKLIIYRSRDHVNFEITNIYLEILGKPTLKIWFLILLLNFGAA